MVSPLRIGDRVVYPGRGVAEIGQIVDQDIAGHVQRFYVLRLLDGLSNILIPVERCAELGLRQVVGERDVRRVFALLGTQGARRAQEPWVRRQRELLEKIHGGNLFELAKVVRDLTELGTYKPLSFGERRLLESTRRLLVQELSVARGVSSDHIERQVSRLLSRTEPI
jgi:CarD family transcriptional regulator